ncbi:hypothetical protein FB451DRAFT_1198958 [Mycena latifolia]|nr:hypothetical protein FB451DRAFT_1198958 [Mycena latifolia]
MCSSLRFWQPLPRLPPPAPLGTQSSAPPYAPILRISDPIFLFPTRVLGSSTLARIHAGLQLWWEYRTRFNVSSTLVPHNSACSMLCPSSTPLHSYSMVRWPAHVLGKNGTMLDLEVVDVAGTLGAKAAGSRKQ